MIEVPAETRIVMQQFWAEQKAKKAARLAEKRVDTKKQEEVLAKLRNPCSGKKIVEYGLICGCGVQHGGREGTYLVAPNGSRLPVSVHPKDVSPGMRNAAYKFIKGVVVAQAAVI